MTPADASTAALADAVRVAERVREACVRAFAEAYEEAGMLGLCAEGRLEAAVGAVRSLDVAGLAAAGSTPPLSDTQESSR